jgi:hypothetical protein
MLLHESDQQEPRIIFLDQNHWIYLSRAYHSRPDGAAFREILERLLTGVRNGIYRIPLSLSHLIEHARASDADRRRRLAEVYEVLSRGWFFGSLSDIVPDEPRRAVAHTFNTGLIFPRPEVFGRGVAFGLGSSGRARLATDVSNLALAAFLEMTRQPGAVYNLATNLIEENRIRQNDTIRRGAEATIQAAEDLRTRRRPHSPDLWRRAQAAEYMLLLQEELQRALWANALRLDDFVALGPEGMTDFFAQVPTVHVDCELMGYRDRQWSRSLEVNDISDLWYLMPAVPYCDVVVTERLWRRAIMEQRLHEHYRTIVISDLRDLAAELPPSVGAA